MKKDNHQLRLEDVELLAPITQPSKILCVGLNYKDHCEEQNKPIPSEPVVFNKFPSCILAPNQTISYPQMTNQLDWEVELALVIGRKGYYIPQGVWKSQKKSHSTLRAKRAAFTKLNWKCQK